jgi:hypothetical protein
MRVIRGLAVGVLCCTLMGGVADAKPRMKKRAKAATPELALQVLSNRPELISAGDALVAVRLPGAVDPSTVKVTLAGTDVSDRFAVRENGRFEALLTGLAVGENPLKATSPGAGSDALTIVNHPNGGPVLSGPQIHPWVCQATAVDAQCNQPESYEYRYKSSTTGQFSAYDPDSPPSDVATTTTDQGKTVPYVVRVETGYQARDQYKIAVLYDPAKPWTAWAPQEQFNHKLLITHGASCGIDHQAGSAPDVMDDEALGRGFAVMSTALNNAGHDCDLVKQAESMIMAKERIVERYGELRYTIGTGCSGGSLTQQQVANAYPGIYQGILPQCSFPDAWTTGNQLVDYHQVRKYVEDPTRWAPGVVWDPVSISAVEGHPNHVNSIILDSLYLTALGDPANPCAGVTAEQRWSTTNTAGVRCTLADYMVNVFDRRASDGYAGRPLDNVGLQYGLNALMAGKITKQQFVDLNVKIGGADINAIPQPERTAADEPALRNAHRSGAINDASNLDQVAIIDLRGSDDGAFHDAYRAFSVRARLEREHGTYGNQVIWRGPVPLLGGPDFTTQGLIAMDRWLTAVEKDDRDVPLARKIRDDRPADVRDRCDTSVPGTDVPDGACPAIVRVYQTPRMVAGESIVTDTNKCRLKPLRRSDYLPTVEFTDAEWAQLQQVFPDGVCDFSEAGVDSETPTLPWMTYDVVGGEPLPGVTATSGWMEASFRGLRSTPAAKKLAKRAAKRARARHHRTRARHHKRRADN